MHSSIDLSENIIATSPKCHSSYTSPILHLTCERAVSEQTPVLFARSIAVTSPKATRTFWLIPKNTADRARYVRGIKCRRCHLVEEGLEKIEVVFINNNDVYGFIAEALGSAQAAKPAPNDVDSRAWRGTWCWALIRRCHLCCFPSRAK